MSIAARKTSAPAIATLADLLAHLGDISPERIRFRPAPGTATEKDVIEIHDRENRLYELVDGVLVEKIMAFYESRVGVVLGGTLDRFAETEDLGIVVGADGMIRLAPGLVRIPDVSFISWDQFPNREIPRDSIPDLFPNLAVEVLSEGNTKKEMGRKVLEYFRAGAQMVWLIDPETQTAEVYTSPSRSRHIGKSGTLTGGKVLPGFRLPLQQLFARAGKRRRNAAKHQRE